MELRHLRYFVAVAEHLNFRRAAESLNVSQPPLSAQIADLEYELGVKLFTRERKRIALTDAGAAFLPRAKDILERAGSAKRDAGLAAQGMIGTLKIRFLSSAVSGVLQDIVSGYKKKYSNVELQLEQSVGHLIAQDVASGKIDIGFVRIPASIPETVQVTPVLKESYAVALPTGHKLCAKDRLSARDLKGEKLIIYGRETAPASFDDVLSLFAKEDFTPDIAQTAPEQLTIAGLVASGMGYSIVPECMMAIKVPGVTHRPLIGGKGRTGIVILTAKKKSPLLQGFLETVKVS